MAEDWSALGAGMIRGAENFVAGNRWQAEQEYKKRLDEIAKQIQERQISVQEAQQKAQEARDKRDAAAAADERDRWKEGTPEVPGVTGEASSLLPMGGGGMGPGTTVGRYGYQPAKEPGISRQNLLADIAYKKSQTEPDYGKTSAYEGIEGIPEGDPISKRWLTNDERHKMAQAVRSQSVSDAFKLQNGKQSKENPNYGENGFWDSTVPDSTLREILAAPYKQTPETAMGAVDKNGQPDWVARDMYAGIAMNSFGSRFGGNNTERTARVKAETLRWLKTIYGYMTPEERKTQEDTARMGAEAAAKAKLAEQVARAGKMKADFQARAAETQSHGYFDAMGTWHGGPNNEPAPQREPTTGSGAPLSKDYVPLGLNPKGFVKKADGNWYNVYSNQMVTSPAVIQYLEDHR